jgi:hypothetical protein
MANKAGIINADTGVIVGVPDALVQVGGVWTIAATAPGTVPASRQINTTAPLTGGGDLSADRTLAIAAATAGNDGYMTSTQVATLATAASTAGAALPKAGGTMTGAIDMGSQKITSLGTPTATTDAATKGYVDTAVVGLLDLKGSIDCSGNPNYPAALKGDVWVISVAGLIGGASGISVQAGDAILALADNAGGTQAAVGSSWSILQANLVGALLAANNLSDVGNTATARTNLGLGTAATANSTDFVARTGDTMSGSLVLGSGASLTMSGGTLSGQGNIRMGAAANPAYDSNLLYADANTRTMGMVCSATPAFGAANGPYVGMRGNTYSAISSQRGNVFFAAGNPSTPAAAEGAIIFLTGADQLRMRIDNSGFVGINYRAAIASSATSYLLNFGATTKGLHEYNSGGTGNDSIKVIGSNPGATFGVQNANASGFSGVEYLDNGGTVRVFTGYQNSTGEFRFNQLAAGGTIVFKISSNNALEIANSRAVTVPVSLKIGTSGTAITQQTVYTPTLTPAAVSAGAPAEQTFAVTGLATTDTVTVNAPGAAVFNSRVSAANTLAITFMPPAAGSYTPPAGTYRIVAIRS